MLMMMYVSNFGAALNLPCVNSHRKKSSYRIFQSSMNVFRHKSLLIKAIEISLIEFSHIHFAEDFFFSLSLLQHDDGWEKMLHQIYEVIDREKFLIKTFLLLLFLHRRHRDVKKCFNPNRNFFTIWFLVRFLIEVIALFAMVRFIKKIPLKYKLNAKPSKKLIPQINFCTSSFFRLYILQTIIE